MARALTRRELGLAQSVGAMAAAAALHALVGWAVVHRLEALAVSVPLLVHSMGASRAVPNSQTSGPTLRKPPAARAPADRPSPEGSTSRPISVLPAGQDESAEIHANTQRLKATATQEEGPGAGAERSANPVEGSKSATGLSSDCWQTVAAELARRATTELPQAVRARGLEGETVLRFTLTPGGQVHDLQVEHSSGHALLDRAALGLLEESLKLSVPCSGIGRWPIRFRRS